jgi:hypothetical protein
MVELSGFLLWLICIGISAILIGYTIKYSGIEESIVKREGFVVYSCPSNTVKYITRHGETNCCNGDIVDNECNGNNVCSLSPRNSLGIQSCQTYVTNLANQAAAAKCFTDMPYYFASTDGSLQGCSVSQPTPDGTAPSDPTKLQCILYPTDTLDKIKLDSCYNYKKNKKVLTAAAECKIVAPTLPESYTPVQNTILMKKFAMTQDYEIEFDITPTAAPSSTWQNILHFSSNNTDTGGLGSRSPAIWFVPGTLNLHVRVGDSTNFNFGFDSQAGCTQGNQSHVNLRCRGNTVILTIDSNIYKLTQPTYRYSGNVIVYGSDPWYPAAKCSIENLRIQNYASVAPAPVAAPVAAQVAAPVAALVAPAAPVKPIPPSSTNPNDYILTGGNPPVSNLQVSKILADDYRFYFFAQNGENINYIVLKSDKPKFVYFYSGLVKGKIAEITDANSFNILTQKGALPGSDYIAKKKDGSETYGP